MLAGVKGKLVRVKGTLAGVKGKLVRVKGTNVPKAQK